MYLLISQKKNMKNKDNDIDGKHIESDTTSQKRRLSFAAECYRTHLKAFQKSKGSLKII